jgi:hypothetical protein
MKHQNDSNIMGEKMEPREVVACSLGAVLAFVILAIVLRYRHKRRQFKLRQSGRGKSVALGDDLSNDS